MISKEKFSQLRNFIYRNGNLLTRKRFAFHFEEGTKEAVLTSLSGYQNSDGGFGNGLELDIMCPESSGICTEMALGYFRELNISEGPEVEKLISWIHNSTNSDGLINIPIKLKEYPHGPWWQGDDHHRILAIAGILAQLNCLTAEIQEKAYKNFEKHHRKIPDEIGIYDYPLSLFLRYVDVEKKYSELLDRLENDFTDMLKRNAEHYPLFFCHDRWNNVGISQELWESEGKRVVSSIQEDGGVMIEQYRDLPWWRPVWTLDMLIVMKQQRLLDTSAFDI